MMFFFLLGILYLYQNKIIKSSILIALSIGTKLITLLIIPLLYKKLGVRKILTTPRNKLDLLNLEKVKKYLKKNKPDIVINCAGRVGGILANSTYPVEFLNENIFIQLNLINSSYKNNIKHFIYASSSSVYGDSKKFPLKENQILNPKNIYGLSKKLNEQTAKLYSKC